MTSVPCVFKTHFSNVKNVLRNQEERKKAKRLNKMQFCTSFLFNFVGSCESFLASSSIEHWSKISILILDQKNWQHLLQPKKILLSVTNFNNSLHWWLKMTSDKLLFQIIAWSEADKTLSMNAFELEFPTWKHW